MNSNIDIWSGLIFSHDKWGRTPLLWAARYGHVNLVRCLLDNGADADRVEEVRSAQ